MKTRLFASLILVQAAYAPGFAAEDSTYAVTGRVTDSTGRAVAGAEVRLWQHGADKPVWTRSNGRGAFAIKHPLTTQDCTLEVIGPAGMDLASTTVEKVPGNQTRFFIVALHKGFLVSGRVVHEGKGLKGIVVRATAEDVHGGGTAVTGRDGAFEFVLTPGKKHLAVANDRYGDLAKEKQRAITVTSDVTLPDIDL